MSARHRAQAWGEIWNRYKAHFAYAWANRATLTTAALNADEAEFLPAALSLQARPVSPLARWVAFVLILLIAVVLAWSILSRIDIVATASGKVIPSDRIKTIASVEVAAVRALHVQEGQAVRAGEVLVELDARGVESARDKAAGDALIATLQAARARALINAVDTGSNPGLNAMPNVPQSAWQDAELHLQSEWQQYLAKLNLLDVQIRHAAAALPLAAERARDYQQLARDNDVPRHAFLEKEQARIDLQGQLNEARSQRAELQAETRKSAQDSLADAMRTLNEASHSELQASAHQDLLRLLAPVDGTVQQLTIHTLGGVVPAAQPLMQIVPLQGVVEVEAFLENRDIGFVREGQLASVKVEAFDYTRFGTIPAKVIHVSRDAIPDEKRGLLYSVKVELERSAIEVDGQSVRLAPGMSVSVEILTGTRRVIEYVLSPLVRHARESLHER